MAKFAMAFVIFSTTFATAAVFAPWPLATAIAQACPNGVCPNR